MPAIELRHLAALVAVVQEGSFGRAADRLGYAQSTVSHQIAALERDAGGAVFERPGGPRAVRLTPLGDIVLGHARELLAGVEGLRNSIDRFRAGEGRIEVGTFQSVSSVLLPAVLRRLRDEYPGCDIRVSEEEPEHPRLGDLDLLFHDSSLDQDVDGLDGVKLLDDPYLLVARTGAFPEGPVSLAGLDGVPLVAWPLICDQPGLEQALASHGARPDVIFRSAINETLLAMVRAGMGATILPSLAVMGAEVRADGRLRVHQLDPAPPPRGIHLYWRLTTAGSPLAARAIELAIEIAAHIGPTNPSIR